MYAKEAKSCKQKPITYARKPNRDKLVTGCLARPLPQAISARQSLLRDVWDCLLAQTLE